MISGSFISNSFESVNENYSCFKDNEFKTTFFGTLYNKADLGFDQQISNAEATYSLYKININELSKLDGSFTIIITNKSSTTIVRDHHGTSHQIYYNHLYYASSLLDLSDTPHFDKNIKYSSLASFLNIGYISTPNTAFENVYKLAAGTAIIVNYSYVRILKLHNPSFTPATSSKSLEELSNEYGMLHSKAINRRIGDSQNVGILLSGGYDSGCNLAALRKIYNGEINSYSIGFKGDNWSELPLARCMSNTFGTNHHEYEITGKEILALPDIVKHLGDPFVEGGLMVNYCAMRMIGNAKPDIILGGDGSDQYFGTSGRETAIHYLASKYGLIPVLRCIHAMLSHKMFETGNKAYRIRFHLDKIINILQGDLFGMPRFMIQDIIIADKYNFRLDDEEINTSSYETLYTQHAIISDLKKIINQVIIFKASRMAEMFGNNIAYPYMDNTLYDFLQQLPVEYKCRGENVKAIARGNSTAKFLLKYHYKPQLPTEITSKKKQGGFAPMPIFFKNDIFRSRIADFILNSSAIGSFLNKKSVEAFILQYENDLRKGNNWFWYNQNKAIQYFNLLTLSIWWETYVNRNNSITL